MDAQDSTELSSWEAKSAKRACSSEARGGNRIVGRISQEMRGACKSAAHSSADARRLSLPSRARSSNARRLRRECANVRFVLLSRIAASGYVSQLFVCGSD